MATFVPSNAAILGRQSQAWAAKKRAREGQVKEITFDDSSRREYLTGFHKRNVARQIAGKARALEKEKTLKQELRKQKRDELQARARENRIAVEKAYGNETIEQEEEFIGLALEKGKEKKDDVEYEDEQIVATVTVVDDLDLDDLDNDGSKPAKPPREAPTAQQSRQVPPGRQKSTSSRPTATSVKSAAAVATPAKKHRRLSYETKGERLQQKREEKAKRVKRAIERREEGTTERRRLKKAAQSRGRR